ncbi:MAG: hypothetical protein KBT27_01905 [Prevotellaceae bacterium]|nr:hypothetical protein [Candidatus Faecinaster equi]
MNIDITSFFFNSSIEGGTATCAWGTSIGQNATKECRVEDEKPGVLELLTGMVYKSCADTSKLDISAGSSQRDLLICSIFDKVFVNGIRLEGCKFILTLVRELSPSHKGRLIISYPSYAKYDNEPINKNTMDKMATAIGCNATGCWFVHDISIRNQDELHFSSVVVDPEKPQVYTGSSSTRSKYWQSLVSDNKAYNLAELGTILRNMYDNAENGKQVAMLYVFVFQYGQYLVDVYKSKEIIEAAGLNGSYSTEIDKAYNVYRYVTKKKLQLFFNDNCCDGYRLDLKQSLQLTDLLSSPYRQYLTAIKTKPFLLLAGISGTGKSRIVRELAFKSCPKYLQDKDGTTPGNYCMIEVKPNWHDSTELLGYYSNLSKSYQFKKFVKFLVKAKMFPDVPFFVCLDEMNLAPVEQYFAEILSILETRKVVTDEYGNRNIKTGTIIDAEHFKALGKIGDFTQNFTDRDIYMKLHDIATESDIAEEVGNRTDLTTEGLTLPDNVIIIGTVNMDDTTHQFSRKVIDRAMTIEMNGGKLKKMFGGSNNLAYLEEEEQKKWQAAFKQRYVSADEVLEAHPDKAEEIIKLLPEKLEAINVALKGTPFEVSYRVLNELTIMVGVMLDAESEAEFETIVNKALDRILLMKILPRIEGDSDMFNLKAPQKVGDVTCHNRLEWLRELAPSITATEEEGKEHQQTAKEKIEEMIERLNNQEFTRFWP